LLCLPAATRKGTAGPQIPHHLPTLGVTVTVSFGPQLLALVLCCLWSWSQGKANKQCDCMCSLCYSSAQSASSSELFSNSNASGSQDSADTARQVMLQRYVQPTHIKVK
jgi:hypothetical protein